MACSSHASRITYHLSPLWGLDVWWIPFSIHLSPRWGCVGLGAWVSLSLYPTTYKLSRFTFRSRGRDAPPTEYGRHGFQLRLCGAVRNHTYPVWGLPLLRPTERAYYFILSLFPFSRFLLLSALALNILFIRVDSRIACSFHASQITQNWLDKSTAP